MVDGHASGVIVHRQGRANETAFRTVKCGEPAVIVGNNKAASRTNHQSPRIDQIRVRMQGLAGHIGHEIDLFVARRWLDSWRPESSATSVSAVVSAVIRHRHPVQYQQSSSPYRPRKHVASAQCNSILRFHTDEILSIFQFEVFNC